MRVLIFGAGNRQYEIAYQALLFSPVPVQRTERKVHGELLDKLEAIGEPKPVLDAAGQPRAYGPDEVMLYVCPLGGSVRLSEAEYDVLTRHVTAIVDGPTFQKALLREADRLVDYLEKLPAESAT